MATLNVKGLPDGLYRKLRARAKRERRSVAQETIHILEQALHPPRQFSLLDLRGLGQEHFKGLSAARHVERERRAWD
jgi:plasmid stability protein